MAQPFRWPSIAADEGVTIVGPRRSGKTLVLKALLRGCKNAIVLDTKRNEDWRMVGRYVKREELRHIKGGRFIYRIPDEMQGQDARAGALQSALLEALLRARKRRIAFDEVADFKEKTRGFTLVTKRGGADNVTLYAATQRPCDVDLTVLSEAMHFFVFFLRLEDDRKRVQKMTHGAAIPWAELHAWKHSFAYIDGAGEVYGPSRLPDRLVQELLGDKEKARRIA